MEKTLSLLKPIDLFALVPMMTFARDGKVYSKLSLLLTLLTLGFIFCLTAFLGLSLFQKRNPSLIQYQSKVDDQLPFGDETFPIRIQSYVDSLTYQQDYYYHAYLDIVDYESSGCLDNGSWICFKRPAGADKNGYLREDDGSWNPAWFFINIFQCDTPGSGCKTEVDIQKGFSRSNLNFMYWNYVVDPVDLEIPLKRRTINFKQPFMKDSFPVVTLYLEVIEFTSDNGWIFENSVTETRIGVNRIESYMDDMEDRSTGLLGSIRVKYEGDHKIYMRTYPKIQDLLAQITGVTAFVLPVLAILAAPFAELKMREHLINELYEVKINKKSRSRIGNHLDIVSSKNNDNGMPKQGERRENTSMLPLTDHFGESRIRINPNNVSMLESDTSRLQTNPAKRRQQDNFTLRNTERNYNSTQRDYSLEPEMQQRGSLSNYQRQPSPGNMRNHGSSLAISQNRSRNNTPRGNSVEPEPQRTSIFQRQQSPKTHGNALVSTINNNSRNGFPKTGEEGNWLNHPSSRLRDGGRGTRNSSVSPVTETFEKPKASYRTQEINSMPNQPIPSKKPSYGGLEMGQDEMIDVVKGPVLINQARNSERLNVNFWQFLQSFVVPQPEIDLINKAEEVMSDTMDIAHFSKKCSDVDKLKVLLLTPQERAIFDNIPVSILTASQEKEDSEVIVDHCGWENSMKGDVEKVNDAYMNLKKLDQKSELQKKLLGLYETQCLHDFFIQEDQ